LTESVAVHSIDVNRQPDIENCKNTRNVAYLSVILKIQPDQIDRTNQLWIEGRSKQDNMKIQLERNLNAHFHQFHCVSCQEIFTSNRLRTLLCHDDGSISGDVCGNCIKQGNSHIQHQLKTRSIELFRQLSTDDMCLSGYRQALELTELAAQPLSIPPFYSWWWKKITILAAETQELEAARRESANCRYRQQNPHKITFRKEEPKIGKDN
jgi:hypothetical protein